MSRSGEASIVGVWLRLDLRRRWRSLAVLALLIAVAGGTVLTAVAGARRGETAIERLWAGTRPATAAVLPNQPGFDWDAVARLPQVEALGRFCGIMQLDGVKDSEDAISGACDGNLLTTLETPVLFAGRLPNPTAIDEAVVTTRFVTQNGLDVGDSVTAHLFSDQQVDAFENGGEQPRAAQGPTVRIRIVGVIRSPWFSERVDEPGQFVPSLALVRKYPVNLVAAYANALVRLEGGEAGLPAFERGLAQAAGRSDIDVRNLVQFRQHDQKVTTFEARCLLAFAGAVLLAALVLIGQAVVRFVAATLADLAVLLQLGLTRSQAVVAASAGPFLAAIAGTLLALAGAVLASPFFPIGTAAASEPAPGLDADPLVLVAGGIAIPLLVLAGAAAAAALGVRHSASRAAVRRPGLSAAIARAGLPIPVVVGSRFALESGRGPGAVPVRSALTGAVAGVLGVVAALTFAHAVNDASTHPRRFGQTHQLEATLGFGGQDFVPAGQVLTAVSRVPGVGGVNDTRFAVAKAGPGGVPVTVHSYAPVGRPLDVVLTAGRLPRADDEVVLARDSARLLGASPGGRITLQGEHAARELTVTGIGFVPSTFHNGYATGGWVSRSGYADLFSSDKGHNGLVSLAPGADPGVVQAGIARALSGIKGAQAAAFLPPEPPSQLAEIRQVRLLPLVLGAFLAVLALGAVGHALATAVRRRRQDIAVLRVLGMTRWQCRWIVVTQATVLAVTGLVFGVPLGVAAGRLVWRVVADYTPLQYVAPLAFWTLLLAVPVALLAANLLAAWPGHRATRLQVAQVLRAE